MPVLRWSYIAPATLACLLAFTASAFAECAWVLWQKSELLPSQGEIPTKWESLEAHQSKDACESRSLQVGETWRKTYSSSPDVLAVTPGPASLLVMSKDNTVFLLSRRCLPDTVDPRGPKR